MNVSLFENVFGLTTLLTGLNPPDEELYIKQSASSVSSLQPSDALRSQNAVSRWQIAAAAGGCRLKMDQYFIPADLQETKATSAPDTTRAR